LKVFPDQGWHGVETPFEPFGKISGEVYEFASMFLDLVGNGRSLEVMLEV
jgi:hypothetical protein